MLQFECLEYWLISMGQSPRPLGESDSLLLQELEMCLSEVSDITNDGIIEATSIICLRSL
jgi:hypothetical protein